MDICKAMELLDKQEIDDPKVALATLGNALQIIPGALRTCHAAEDAIKSISKTLQILKHPWAMV